VLHKRGNNWYIQIKWQGHLIRKTTHTDNKELAQKLEAKIMSELLERKYFDREPGETILFKEAWEKYMREIAKYTLSKSGLSLALHTERKFLPFAGHLTLKQITPAILSSYKAKRLEEGIKINSAVKELCYVRRCFSLCKKEWQFVKQSPFEYFTMPSVNDKRVRFFKPGEFESLFRHSPAWLKPMIIISKETGLRKDNVIHLTWQMFNEGEKILNIPYTKNGDPIAIPLTDAAFEVLMEIKKEKRKVVFLDCPFVFHDKGKPYAHGQVSMAFKRACARAGVENFRFHDLRHDYASRLAQRGNSLYVIQNLLGHRDSRMTQRYAHLHIEALKKAVETLNLNTKRHTDEDASVRSA
jgi:integrase